MSWSSAAPQVIDKNKLLIEWQDAEKRLINAKATEIALRAQVVEAFYPAHKDEGTENIDLGKGYKLKAVFKNNYRFQDKDKVEAALVQIEEVDAKGQYIAERIIRWKPELDKREYDACPMKYRRFIDAVLTTKPGTPQLEIVEPKSKK